MTKNEPRVVNAVGRESPTPAASGAPTPPEHSAAVALGAKLGDATAAAGSTIRFGTMRWRMSIIESVTRTAQKPAASTASAVGPKTAKQATMSAAVTPSTTG